MRGRPAPHLDEDRACRSTSSATLRPIFMTARGKSPARSPALVAPLDPAETCGTAEYSGVRRSREGQRLRRESTRDFRHGLLVREEGAALPPSPTMPAIAAVARGRTPDSPPLPPPSSGDPAQPRPSRQCSKAAETASASGVSSQSVGGRSPCTPPPSLWGLSRSTSTPALVPGSSGLATLLGRAFPLPAQPAAEQGELIAEIRASAALRQGPPLCWAP